jgi:hypothetical protein
MANRGLVVMDDFLFSAADCRRRWSFLQSLIQKLLFIDDGLLGSNIL